MLLCFLVTKYDQMLVFKVINYKVWICFFACIFVKVLLVPMGNWFLSPRWSIHLFNRFIFQGKEYLLRRYVHIRLLQTLISFPLKTKELTFMKLWVIDKLLLKVLFSELWWFQIKSCSNFRMSVLWSDTLKRCNTVSFKLGFKTVL